MDKARHIKLGKEGEDLAENLLEKKGFKILARNYKMRLGQIDIIAKEKDTICFVEVKTRKSSDPDGLGYSLNTRKIRHLSRVALEYLKTNNLLGTPARFDVIWVIILSGKPHLNIIRNAFELDRRYTY